MRYGGVLVSGLGRVMMRNGCMVPVYQYLLCIISWECDV